MKVSNLIFVLIITFSLSFAQWIRKPDVPEDVGPGGGITYGRGYVFAVVGRERDGFYAFDISGDSWITNLEGLPQEIYRVGGITYGKNEFSTGYGSFKLENVFVLAQIEDDDDQIFIYTFNDTIGAEGEWDYYELPENIELGAGASITFRPTNYTSFDSSRWCYTITLGELYFTQGNMTSNFYCVPIREIRPELLPPPIPVDWVFPPNNGKIDAMKIFFRWETIPNANYYYLQVDKNPDFSSPILDITTDKNIYNSKKIFSNGVYYWRIRPDYSLIWSQTRKFQIIDTVIRKRGLRDGVDSGGAITYHRFKERESDTTFAESIYCFVGGGRRNFYCYSVNQDSWFQLDFSPMYQNNGSSITSSYQSSDPIRKQQLLAIFGRTRIPPYPRHWIYSIIRNKWAPWSEIPENLGPGASITFDWQNNRDDGYLVIGDNRPNFYVNRDPFFEEISSSEQSLTTNKKTKILFNSQGITFSYYCEIPSYGEISVYNLYGKKIKRLFNGKMEKGEYQLIWNKGDEKGKKVSSGIYFITINTKEKRERIKVIIK
ncbi:MAG: T9SS type A sorting domain-containing protein [Nitrososphaerota archaeon]